MILRRVVVSVVSILFALSLGSCGTAASVPTYTEKSISSTRSKCADNEDDMTMVQTEKSKSSIEISAWYNSFEDGAQGVASNLFQCVIKSLKIPGRISERMDSKQARQITDKVDNLYVSWYRDDLQLSAYLGLEKPTKNKQAYYGTQTLKWLDEYCQSEVEDQESLEFRNGSLGLDSLNVNGDEDSGALACISFQLGFDDDLTEEIESPGSQDWNRLAGNYYVGWTHGDGLTLAVSATKLKE